MSRAPFRKHLAPIVPTPQGERRRSTGLPTKREPCSKKCGTLISYVVRTAALLETLEEARVYYEARLVGEHVIETPGDGDPLVLRFNREEIHLYTEELRPGTRPNPAMLVQRSGRSGEVRRFSRVRARLMDQIIPTISNPVACLEAKIPGGRMLVGPPTLEATQRLVVVVAPDSDDCVYFVRTAYPMSQTDYARALRVERRARWPP
jgi:hypothetical protein